MAKEGKILEMKRHSLAHIMALALKRIYKNISYGIGPSNEVGFYYLFMIRHGRSRE